MADISNNNQSQAGAPAQNIPKTGSNFTNLQQYLNANQDNTLGQTVAGNVNDASNKEKNQLVTSQADFNTQAQNQLQATDSNVANRNSILSNPATIVTGGQPTSGSQQLQNNPGGIGKIIDGRDQSTQSNTSGYSVDPTAVSQFQQYLNPNYTKTSDYGTNGQLNNLSNLQNKASNVQQLGSSLSNNPNASSGGQKQNSGTQALLQHMYGGQGQYTQGQSALDNLMLYTPGANTQALLDARHGSSGAVNSVNNAELQAENLAQSTAARNQQFGTDTQQGLTNAITGIGETISGAPANGNTPATTGLIGQNKTNQTAAITALQNALASGTMTKAQADQLGLTQGQSLYNIGQGTNLTNAMSYVTPNDINFNTVATPQQRASLYALGQLGGSNLANYDAKGYTSNIDPTAKQYDSSNPYSIDKNSFQGLLSGNVAGSAAYQNALNQTQWNPASYLQIPNMSVNGAEAEFGHAGANLGALFPKGPQSIPQALQTLAALRQMAAQDQLSPNSVDNPIGGFQGNNPGNSINIPGSVALGGPLALPSIGGATPKFTPDNPTTSTSANGAGFTPEQQANYAALLKGISKAQQDLNTEQDKIQNQYGYNNKVNIKG